MAELVDLAHVMHARDRPVVERALAAIASRQHGVVAHGQLTALGFGRGAIQHRLALGRLHRIHRGVYAVGHSAITPRGRWLAAVIACGPGALLSHRDAGALWELRAGVAAPVDVIYPGRSRYGRPGLSLHHVRHLHPDDRAERHGIPVTTVARTLLDLAQVLRPRPLRAFDQAERIRLLDVAAVERVCDRCRGHPGRRSLAALLSLESSDPPDTRSNLERRFLDLCLDACLPRPAVNVVIAGYEVDAAWLRERVVVEVDGHAYHRSRLAFERDRARDGALQVAGYRVMRVTHRRIQTEPAALVGMLRSLLSSQPPVSTSGRPHSTARAGASPHSCSSR